VNRRVPLIATAVGVCTAALILVAVFSSPDQPPEAVVERRAPAPASLSPATSPRSSSSAPEADAIVKEVEVQPGPSETPLPAPGTEPSGEAAVLQIEADVPGAQVDVVHRHGVGSCRGRLVATSAGIRYDTENKDDAFSAALLDLETFRVDYLAKNLRVRLPKGRQLNFTDPEGNADRLFVFHRDVERARERIRKGDTPAS
jgi:hypothetical protein